MKFFIFRLYGVMPYFCERKEIEVAVGFVAAITKPICPHTENDSGPPMFTERLFVTLTSRVVIFAFPLSFAQFKTRC